MVLAVIVPTTLPRISAKSAVIATSTWPVSATDKCATFRSPFTLPSSCTSPSLTRSPARLTFSAINEQAIAFLGEASSARGPEDTGLFGLLNIGACLDEAIRILGAAVDPHLIVQMRASGAASRAHAAQSLSNAHLLADADRNGRQMSVARLEAAAVIYLDGIAITRTHAGE